VTFAHGSRFNARIKGAILIPSGRVPMMQRMCLFDFMKKVLVTSIGAGAC
jgi:hypothetical protein